MSERLWKATRPDGTDFYSGSVDYAAALASGEPVTVEPSGDGGFPGAGWLHASTVPTDCVGMDWPCRLFVVEPADDLQERPRRENKVGARSLRVVEERPGHEALGPQGEQVAALIERSRTLSAAELDRLHDTWGFARAAARAAARDAAWGAAWGAAWDAARDAALSAAWDAAVALLCRDLIGQAPGWDQAAYDRLTGPWRRVIGPIHPDDAPMEDDDE